MMDPDKELLERLISDHSKGDYGPPVSLADYLTIHLVCIRQIKEDLAVIQRHRDMEMGHHIDNVKGFDKEVKKIQDKCKHLSTQRHSDPSGNNDSFTECRHCGKVI